MIRPILIHPDPRLKKLCDPVKDITDDLRKLASDMLDTMYDAPGIGLAAPQVGVTKRLIVMDCIKSPDTPRPLILFNPEVIWTSEDLTTYEEGCLSIPEFYEMVERPKDVKVRYLDRMGEPHEIAASGILATVLQHEIDHLNGILFIDYISKLKRDRVVKKFQKAQKLGKL